jgi:RNA polymerase sigma-70 factor (ECF subfamily)
MATHDDATSPRASPPAAVTDAAVHELRERLKRSVARICPSWLARHADDIIQIALLRVLDVLRAGGNRGLSASYLKRAAYSAAVDEMRRQFRRREVSEEDLPALQSLASAAAGPEQVVLSSEIGRGITDCLGALVPPRRLAVTLHLQGCPVPEVGRRLGWSTKKAEHLVYRALEQLRECLTRKGLNP